MYKMFMNAKDPMSAYTHFIGFLAVIPCFIFLLIKAHMQTVWHMIGFAVFGCSLMLLYGASTIYHTIKTSPKNSELLRRIDHAMIFVLIAGSYTPICLTALNGKTGFMMLTVIWVLTILGIIVKMCWWSAPRWLSTGLYVGMGWLAMLIFMPLKNVVGASGTNILLLGGIAYTLGAVIYVLKKPNFNFKYFGFHEIFHVFVMAGSGIHILFMFIFL